MPTSCCSQPSDRTSQRAGGRSSVRLSTGLQSGATVALAPDEDTALSGAGAEIGLSVNAPPRPVWEADQSGGRTPGAAGATPRCGWSRRRATKARWHTAPCAGRPTCPGGAGHQRPELSFSEGAPPPRWGSLGRPGAKGEQVLGAIEISAPDFPVSTTPMSPTSSTRQLPRHLLCGAAERGRLRTEPGGAQSRQRRAAAPDAPPGRGARGRAPDDRRGHPRRPAPGHGRRRPPAAHAPAAIWTASRPSAPWRRWRRWSEARSPGCAA